MVDCMAATLGEFGTAHAANPTCRDGAPLFETAARFQAERRLQAGAFADALPDRSLRRPVAEQLEGLEARAQECLDRFLVDALAHDVVLDEVGGLRVVVHAA